jgi:hypothetical protein
MSTGELRRRIEHLEARPPSVAQAQQALAHFQETGELPENPRLRDLIERAVAFEREAVERRQVDETTTGT